MASEKTQADPPGAFDVVAAATIVSDYKFRGLSLSDREPAIQASLDFGHLPSGSYLGVWASSIAQSGGSNAEVDLYAGIKRNLGDFELNLGAQAYLYPGGSNVNSYELYGYAGRRLGPAEMRIGIAYAPDQKNIGNADNLYLTSDLRIGIPNSSFTVFGSIGYEDGGFAGLDGEKWDWSVGVEATKGAFTFGIAFADSDVRKVDDPDRLGRRKFVFSLSSEF